MKRILLTLTLVLVGLVSHAQLNLDWLDDWYDGNKQMKAHENVDTLINRIIQRNDNVYLYDVVNYNKYPDGYVANAVLFEDHDGNFVDMVYIVKRPNITRYVIVGNQTKGFGYDLINYKSKRKVFDIISSQRTGKSEITFDNNSKITLHFNLTNDRGRNYRIFYREFKVDGEQRTFSGYDGAIRK